MLTLKKVNSEIQKKHPMLELVKGVGYFYFVSPESATSEDCDRLDAIDEKSVFIYKLNHMSLDEWLKEAGFIFEKMQSEA